MPTDYELLRRVQGRLGGMLVDRYSWWTHWRELADFILPRRYKWLISPNQASRGSPINGKIVDSTGTIAARTCASGMMFGVTSPTRPWFRLKVAGQNSEGNTETSRWLYQVERMLNAVFSESNFYNAMGVLYHDLVIFGTACLIIYEDFENIIHCYNPCLGEFFFANSDRMTVDTVYREFTLTIAQILQRWPDCQNENVLSAKRDGGALLTRELVVDHAIEPNTDGKRFGIAEHFKWREVYWLRGETLECLSKRGFYEFPCLTPRWDIVSNDAYGRGPGMDGLGDVKQLQQEQIRKAQAIDKHVNPPLIADIQLQNQPASALPGGITFVAGIQNVGMKPIYTVQPPIQEIMMDIAATQDRIKSVFFNDLFRIVSQLNTVRSATEIDARREEQLVLLGPVLERFENEALAPAIDRVFNILSRGKLLPQAPAGIAGQNIQVQYVSMLAAAQRATETSGLERLFAIAGNLAAAIPDVLDNIDPDESITKYAAALAIPPTVLRDRKTVAQLRDARAKAQQQQALLEQTVAGAQGAKTLSETSLGGNKNALQAIAGMPQ